jgi:hypothetical protein
MPSPPALPDRDVPMPRSTGGAGAASPDAGEFYPYLWFRPPKSPGGLTSTHIFR